MYELSDEAWEHRQKLHRNTERLQILMPALRKAGFPEFNVRGDNDYLHAPHGSIIVAIRFEHSVNIVSARMSMSRLPPNVEGQLILQEWLKERGGYSKDNPQYTEYTAKLAARFGYVECDPQQEPVYKQHWEARIAERMRMLASIYVDAMM